ncbi:MAG: CheY-like chemotaxis protein [Candidatus Omnitrophota bacterium]|jgi:CheY-like chemotaxis protein
MRAKKIIIVDDIESHLNRAATQLQENNFDCDVARDGIEAIELITKNDYDLCLMDVQMPFKDGIETTIEIRTQMKLDLPIIAHTSFGESIRETCIQAGMNDLIAKPASKRDLIDIITLWI